MGYVFRDGEQLRELVDFRYHERLDTPVSVESIDEDIVRATGLINRYDDSAVVVNRIEYNRQDNRIVSRPFGVTEE